MEFQTAKPPVKQLETRLGSEGRAGEFYYFTLHQCRNLQVFYIF